MTLKLFMTDPVGLANEQRRDGVPLLHMHQQEVTCPPLNGFLSPVLTNSSNCLKQSGTLMFVTR